MKVDLHLGPHRTATTWIQWSAHHHREALAKRGVVFLNEPAQSNAVARFVVQEHPDAALQAFDRLLEAAAGWAGEPGPVATALYSSEVFFEANLARAQPYEEAFASFVEGLAARGHEPRLVFVGRRIEDILVSNALLQVSIGNLQNLSSLPASFVNSLKSHQWLKGFYLERFASAHLSFDAMVGKGDAFVNFLSLLYGIAFDGAGPPPGVEARNSVSDEQIARGLLLAPMLNWVETFGSVSRFEMLNASSPLAAPVPAEAFAAMVAQAPLVRDFMKAMARRVVDRYRGGPPAHG